MRAADINLHYTSISVQLCQPVPQLRVVSWFVPCSLVYFASPIGAGGWLQQEDQPRTIYIEKHDSSDLKTELCPSYL
ncbi:MAG: hypothetical protein ABI210_02640 [Abditibacteriaceae bacterium]